MASNGVGLVASFRPERGGGVSMVAFPVEGFGNVAAPAVEGVSVIVQLFGTAPDPDGMISCQSELFQQRQLFETLEMH